MHSSYKSCLLIAVCVLFFSSFKVEKDTSIKADGNPWPQLKQEMHPWTRWWWMGSAVDENNLDKVLTQYKAAGFGGVEVTPIYGAVGYEKRYIDFLSPQWMSMLNFTVKKANALGMGVDMNTGTGWPFGGPQIKNEAAASKLIVQTYNVDGGKALADKIVLKDQQQVNAGAQLQAVTAYGDKGEVLLLLDKVDNSGQLNWTAPSGKWQVYALFCGRTLQMVKRAAAGGEGLVMDHLNKQAVNTYLKRFDEAFNNKAPGIRAFFNDSYEVYNANWSPNLFDEFKKQRGYDLRLHIKELISADTLENTARVKSDYRETVSNMLLNNFTLNWTDWAHKLGRITKNQAHGSPGNLLDLYSTVDIPECEAYFGLSYFPIPGLRHDTTDVINPNSNANIFKFASSAAHVYGKPLASSETFVWLTDHFKTSLSQCKPEVERLFLGGINHVFYHGTTYSPDDIAFPGWQFYASSNFTPANSLWPHISALNNYIARCQSVLQAGKPDNELLVYWPVYECWANPRGTDLQLTMHNVNEWLTPTAFNKLVTQLQNSGYAMDFASDKMLAQAQVSNGNIKVAPTAPSYKTIVIPSCKYMPVETLQKLITLAQNGATIIFNSLPEDVPGLNDLAKRRSNFKNILSRLTFSKQGGAMQQLSMGKGKIILSNDVEHALQTSNINREELGDMGLKFIRRTLSDGKYYYLVNHTAKPIEGYVPLNTKATSVIIMDPQSGDYGMASTTTAEGKYKVRIQMQPGEALILRTYTNNTPKLNSWKYIERKQDPVTITGNWTLHFTAGGPVLPMDQKLMQLTSWTQLGDSNAIKFSGSGLYSINFNIDKKANDYVLDLGKVNESAHVFINGQDVGILWSIPYTARVGKFLKQGNNTLKIEVANLMANRVRDMDIKGIKWRNYHEINFVNINYRPFDASKWEPQPSGLLGPVTTMPVVNDK